MFGVTPVISGLLAGSAVLAWGTGCGFSPEALGLVGSPLFPPGGATAGGGGVSGGGGSFDQGGGGPVDPCELTNSRKFITLSLRNLASDDFIHYFLALIAYVDDGTGTQGAVCPDDIGIYTDFGYTLIPEGAERAFGSYCIEGPALLYFHESGSFQSTSGLESAIAPAQGNNPSFDARFNASGALVPVPDEILWHNPGTGEGAALQVALLDSNPCNQGSQIIFTPLCDQDAFYYVDEFDIAAGSTALGPSSARRVPNEIQGTQCLSGIQRGSAQLAGAGVTSSNAQDYHFFRGGRIDYAFIREPTDPPIPQLVWRVTDQGGGIVHDFDPRSGVN